MFKNFKDICNVVSLVAYCPSDKTILLSKEPNGDYWIPTLKAENDIWKMTAQKINCQLFGMDAPACTLIRIYKIWIPQDNAPSVYHIVFKVSVGPTIKKRVKTQNGKFQWTNPTELDRLRVHHRLRSPEVEVFVQLVVGETPKDMHNSVMNAEDGILLEISEDNILVNGGEGAAATIHMQHQLLTAAKYTRDDQIRMFREFLMMIFPSMYMSYNIFTQFMVDLGWQRSVCSGLFRAADTSDRGGLSFLDLLLWTAAVEPGTQHSGAAAEMRCRYIFRYFDGNRDAKLEYVEFKELVASTRQMRQLSIDAISVSRDTDLFLKQLDKEPNTQLSVTEFLHIVGDHHLRGTSSLMRAPRSVSGYLADLNLNRDAAPLQATKAAQLPLSSTKSTQAMDVAAKVSTDHSAGRYRSVPIPRPDYTLALFSVRFNRKSPIELIEMNTLHEETVSASSAQLVAGGGASQSALALAAAAAPSEALAAIHYFATPYDKLPRRSSGASLSGSKAAWTWVTPAEELTMGSMLLRLAEDVRVLCANEPRLLRLSAPVYVIGDLHGNLPALLSIEMALWPSGPALAPARLLFLGDYVDRGPYGSELLAYLFASKVQRPNGVFLIRGNHETREIQKMFTFRGECLQKYGDLEGEKIWSAINLVFDVMPLAAVVDDKVFCCHGGIPPPWVCPLMSAIDKIPTPLPRPSEQSSVAWELMWNDPVKQSKITATLALELAANEGFAVNSKRGTGHLFDQSALDRFLVVNQLSHVVRAHEVHQNGFVCLFRGKLVSVFSSSHYCGGNNDTGVAFLEGGKLRLIRVNADY